MIHGIKRSHLVLDLIAGKRVVESHIHAILICGHVAVVPQCRQAASQGCLKHAAARHARRALQDSREAGAGDAHGLRHVVVA